MRIRKYRQADATVVGRLICETYRKYNLSHATSDEQDRLLGPFKHAFSDDVEHQKAIRIVIQSPIVHVAEHDGEIVGVLRGRDHVIASLFVAGSHHGKGIGRRLVARFESDCRRRDVPRVRVASTIFAVPFYQSLGYRKTTGIRPCRSFDGTNLTYQPMAKDLA